MCVIIRCGSEIILVRVYNYMYNRNFRYIGIRYDYINQWIKDGMITVDYIHFLNNFVDFMIKGLVRDLVLKIWKGMDLKFLIGDQ